MSQQKISAAALAKVAKDSAVPTAWQPVKAFLDKLKLSKPSDPDFDKIIAAMEKAKKGMEFWATLVGDKTLTIETRIGSTVVSRPVQTDLSSGGVPAWRAKMQLVHDTTQLLNDADLAKFQKAHPDPAELARLRDRISVLNGEVATLANSLKAKAAERDKAKADYAALGGK
jgi:hypothetical protein